MPFRDGLAFVHDMLSGFDLRDQIKIIAAGKIITGFDLIRAFALGADACYSARAMMLALGCIQALECNQNKCPTGVATQDPELVKGLNVEDKSKRVANYHKETILAVIELLAAAGLESPTQVKRKHIFRRITMQQNKRYDEIYPEVEPGSFLKEDNIPQRYRSLLKEALAESF